MHAIDVTLFPRDPLRAGDHHHHRHYHDTRGTIV